MNKNLAALIAAAMLFVLTACGVSAVPEQTESNRADAVAASETLNNADEIRLNQHFKIGNQSWTVKAGDTDVAKVEGVYMKALGDVLTVMTPSGGVLASEEQDILNLAKTAKFYDANGNKEGVLKKKILSLLAEYRLTDENGNEKAKLDQKFGLLFKGEIKDKNNKTVWKFDSDLGLTAKINLKRVERDTAVTAEDAIRMVIVAAVVNQAESEQSKRTT